MNKKFRFIYKITLLCGSLKDHYYIGQHSTNNINNGVKLKRVHKPDLQKYIDEGWKVGKKF